ncbi:MAG: UDP-N-acetylmuramoyl-tripeptide--D-alanyl-D-alanine ligase [Clostridiales bacterium]|nr:UDP-N-acetylmuramoyl-tripeptide--D-alanyl-D-alanine ligase [Clostridiales bacterium]
MFPLALAILAVGFALYYWGNLRQCLHMMQLNSYYNDRFLKWAKGRRAGRAQYAYMFCAYLCLLAVLLVLRNLLPLELYLILSGAAFFVLAALRKKSTDKKALVYTWRARRLLACAGLLCLLFLLFLLIVFRAAFWWTLPFWLAYLNIAAYLVVLAANTVNKPLEKAVADSFVRDAKRILAERPGLKVIGITGSYGKTSTKNILSQLLSLDFGVLATPESYNTTMGVVRTIREKLAATHEVFVVEMGAKKTGDIKEICDLVKPSMGIISSIGEMHLDTFFTMDNIIRTKYELAEAVGGEGLIFLNTDNEYIRARELSQPTVRYGTSGPEEGRDMDVWAADIRSGPSGSRFDLCFAGGGAVSCQTRLLGRLNVLNIVAASAVAVKLGLAPDKLPRLIARLEPVTHRLQLLPPGPDFQIIDDAFNANPEGSAQALETLGGFPGFRILVTPGMVELAQREEELNRRLGALAAACCDYIIIVGESRAPAIEAGALGAGFAREMVYIAADIQDALAKAGSLAAALSKDEGPVTVLLENDLPDNYL